MKRFVLILISVIAIVSGVVNLGAFRIASAAPLTRPTQSVVFPDMVDYTKKKGGKDICILLHGSQCDTSSIGPWI